MRALALLREMGTHKDKDETENLYGKTNDYISY